MFKLKRLVSFILVFTISFISSLVWGDIGANEDISSFSQPYQPSSSSTVTAPGGDGIDTAASPLPQGYSADAKNLVPSIDRVEERLIGRLNALTAQEATSPLPPAQAAEMIQIKTKLAKLKVLKTAALSYSSTHASCIKTQAAAEFVCNEKTSPTLNTTLNQLNMGLSLVAGVAVNDACSGMAKAFKLAQAGLTLYTTICSSAKATCGGFCSSSSASVVKMVGLIKDPDIQSAISADSSISKTITKEADKEDPLAIAFKERKCTVDYTNAILSSSLGIASIIKSMQQAKQCDDASKGDPNKKEEDICKDATKANTEACKCKVPDSPECICFKNPRTPGCANAFQKPNENSAQNFGLNDPTGSGKKSGGPSGGPGGASMNDNGLGENKAMGSDGGGAGGAGAPMGGSAGLGGGGGGGGAGKGAEIEAGRKGLNANILSGAGGGGGGGSWGGFGGGGGSDKYRAYLPGGAKDPSRGVAGQQSWMKEVTGQGGKSNWEKVRERYQDNKNTLLNN